MKQVERLIHHWKYPYLTVVALSVAGAIYLAGNDSFKGWVSQLGDIGYLGAILAGLLFTSSFTLPISIVVIAILSEELNLVTLAIVGGFGSAFGDYLLLRLIRDRLGDEVTELIGKADIRHINHFLKLKYVSWSLPVLGGLLIASPLPDEIGVGLLGISHISTWKFLLISYVSNVFGILAIASVAKVI